MIVPFITCLFWEYASIVSKHLLDKLKNVWYNIYLRGSRLIIKAKIAWLKITNSL